MNRDQRDGECDTRHPVSFGKRLRDQIDLDLGPQRLQREGV